MFEVALGSPLDTLKAPLYSFYSQSYRARCGQTHLGTLWVDIV